MNENEFTEDGITYVAVEKATCTGCCFTQNCQFTAHPCDGALRADGRRIIWKVKE